MQQLLGGGDGELAERTRHDRALEKYKKRLSKGLLNNEKKLKKKEIRFLDKIFQIQLKPLNYTRGLEALTRMLFLSLSLVSV